MSLNEFSTLEIEPLIAPQPAEPRDASRLLVIDRGTGDMRHLFFRDLPSLTGPDDLLVLNKSRVWKARLPAQKTTGAKTDLLLISPQRPDMTVWTALARKMKEGQTLICGAGTKVLCSGLNADGSWNFKFSVPVNEAYLAEHGEVPLPQYILKARKRKNDGNLRSAADSTTRNPQSRTAPEARDRPVSLEVPSQRPLAHKTALPDFGGPCRPQSGWWDDEARYQTVFASTPGSIAAPTAGFHFTPEVLSALETKGTRSAFVTLHIGWGTFRPVRCKNLSDHVMLEETCFLDAQTASVINAHKERGGRVIAVGTSSMRALETFAGPDGRLAHGERRAGLFMVPGYKFKIAGAFITNLHVPDSAPLYMTAAFAGRGLLFKAYQEAVKEKYRFYSYGDAMMIL